MTHHSSDVRGGGETEQPNFQVGGALWEDYPGYVKRSADELLLNALENSRYAYVLNARQMGKSSLRVQTARALTHSGRVCGLVDISTMQEQGEAQWYSEFVRKLAFDLGLKNSARYLAMKANANTPSGPALLDVFVDQVLLTEILGDVVVFVDEIDSTLNVNFPISAFFATLREFHERRPLKKQYRRLTFVLIGVARTVELAQDDRTTPFNIAVGIELEGFRVTEVAPLVSQLPAVVQSSAAVSAVLSWTGGQPFLTHKAFELLATEAGRQLPTGDLGTWVEQLICAQIVEKWEEHDDPEHLGTIRTRIENFIKRDQRGASELLDLYSRVLSSEESGGLAATRTGVELELRLTGLVRLHEGALLPSNRIYKKVFGREWIELTLRRFRPYNDNLTAWLTSEKHDSSRLLQGKPLAEAIRWAEGRVIPDVEREFLQAAVARGDRRRRLIYAGTILVLTAGLVVAIGVGRSATELAAQAAADANEAQLATKREKVATDREKQAKLALATKVIEAEELAAKASEAQRTAEDAEEEARRSQREASDDARRARAAEARATNASQLAKIAAQQALNAKKQVEEDNQTLTVGLATATFDSQLMQSLEREIVELRRLCAANRKVASKLQTAAP